MPRTIDEVYPFGYEEQKLDKKRESLSVLASNNALSRPTFVADYLCSPRVIGQSVEEPDYFPENKPVLNQVKKGCPLKFCEIPMPDFSRSSDTIFAAVNDHDIGTVDVVSDRNCLRSLARFFLFNADNYYRHDFKIQAELLNGKLTLSSLVSYPPTTGRFGVPFENLMVSSTTQGYFRIVRKKWFGTEYLIRCETDCLDSNGAVELKCKAMKFNKMGTPYHDLDADFFKEVFLQMLFSDCKTLIIGKVQEALDGVYVNPEVFVKSNGKLQPKNGTLMDFPSMTFDDVKRMAKLSDGDVALMLLRLGDFLRFVGAKVAFTTCVITNKVKTFQTVSALLDEIRRKNLAQDLSDLVMELTNIKQKQLEFIVNYMSIQSI